MSKKSFCMVVLPIVFFISACGAPRVDTSSKESYMRSVERVRASLDEDRREEFDRLIVDIVFPNTGDASSPEGVAATATHYSGMTGKELIQEVWAQRGRKAAELRLSRVKELAALEAQLDHIQVGETSLAQVKFENASFWDPIDDDCYNGCERLPITGGIYLLAMDADVVNGTDDVLTAIDFRWALRSLGRSVSWIDGTGHVTIAGGIEPGETRRISIARGTDWSNVEASTRSGQEVSWGTSDELITRVVELSALHPDAVVEVSVRGARFASGTTIGDKAEGAEQLHDRIEVLRALLSDG